MEAGDVVIHNHAYYGASHEPDVGFVVPIFHGGELVGFSVTTAHHLDLGALAPGLLRHRRRDRRVRRGAAVQRDQDRGGGPSNEWIWRLMRDNVRAAQLVVGDMEAQVAACRIGAERFVELLDRYGIETVRAASEELMDYSERMLRREIEQLPDGTYEAEGYIDGFADDPDPANRDLRIKVTVTVEGDTIHVDLTGTSPQISDLPINMPFVGTVDIAIYVTMRSILLDTRPPRVASRRTPGSCGRSRSSRPRAALANPTFPAPTIARFCPGNIVADTLMRALAPVVPESVCAGVGNLKVVAYSGSAATSTGSTWTSRRAATAGGSARTASTPSTPSTRTPATTRSRTSRPTTRSA